MRMEPSLVEPEERRKPRKEYYLSGKEYLTEREAAHYCGVSLAHFNRQRGTYAIPTARFMGKKLYRRRDLDEIIDPLFPGTLKSRVKSKS